MVTKQRTTSKESVEYAWMPSCKFIMSHKQNMDKEFTPCRNGATEMYVFYDRIKILKFQVWLPYDHAVACQVFCEWWLNIHFELKLWAIAINMVIFLCESLKNSFCNFVSYCFSSPKSLFHLTWCKMVPLVVLRTKIWWDQPLSVLGALIWGVFH